ncbi:hypothetical protein BBJ28_00002376 [Nothophytophthora sp. Chile5]|nr:hypothetical protein BBJ28_00002376 [Nothophytophthora sp. Chile5]
MNLLWIRRRKEDETKRQKDQEIQQRVQQWAMDRCRDESENLRKREATKLVAGLEQLSQEEIDSDQPFIWRDETSIRPELAEIMSRTKQATTAASASSRTDHITKKATRPVVAGSAKPPAFMGGSSPVQIVMKSRKPSVSATGGGMHFRNQLPANYVPPGLLTSPSPSAKDRRQGPSASRSASAVGKEPFGSSKRSVMDTQDGSSSASEDEEDPVSSRRRKRETDRQHAMKFQAYHVPYYYTADSGDRHAINAQAASAAAPQKIHPRGTVPFQPLPADPEFRRLHEATAMRQVITLPSEKTVSTGLPRKGATSTSDLRLAQLDEMERIRLLFERNHLSFSPQAFERGLLVPEDRPVLESIRNLPLAGSQLTTNPLGGKTGKAKKKGDGKKKRKKGSKSAKTQKSSRR